MEELIERVSDIMMSPVIRRDIWQKNYRQIKLLCLVCFIFLPSILFCLDKSSVNKDDKVSRFEFISGIYSELFEDIPDTETVKGLGILDPFQDGDMHMDWPITRGVAADAFYRVSLQTAASNKLPRAFADIPQYSELNKILAVVGGAFLPRNQGKFEPDKLLTPKHFQHALQMLKRKEILLPSKGVKFSQLPVYQSTQAKFANIKPIYPELGFSDKPKSDETFIKRSLENIERTRDLSISAQQLNPESVSNINEAVCAMQETKDLLRKFGGSVLELTELDISDDSDELALVDALKQFRKMLGDFQSRFELCREQLKRITIADPKQIQKSDILNVDLNESLKEIEILQKRIRDRLNKSDLKLLKVRGKK